MKARSLLISLIALAGSANAQGFFDRFKGDVGPHNPLQECNAAFDTNERQIIVDAAAQLPGTFGSTYIATNKGVWIGNCMGSKGFHSTFDSLVKYDTQALGRMSRERINQIRDDDGLRAAATPGAWVK